MSGHYLASFLAPLEPWLTRADVTDIYVNAPGALWAETITGATERHTVPQLDEPWLARLARQIAAISAQGFSRNHPLLAASLPDGARVQIAGPPATRGGHILAIRRFCAPAMTIADFENQGAFKAMRQDGGDAASLAPLCPVPGSDAAKTLQAAVRAKRNILISGGTSSGKTTFLNALLRAVPQDERLVLIEDTPELEMTHANEVGLLAARGDSGEAQLTADDLLIAALRLRPDRIILGELRGEEAYTFLRAVNTGHPGSMTTIHADSPARAIEQLTLLVLQTGTRLARDDVRHYVSATIDLFVQLGRSGGRREVTSMLARA